MNLKLGKMEVVVWLEVDLPCYFLHLLVHRNLFLCRVPYLTAVSIRLMGQDLIYFHVKLVDLQQVDDFPR